MLVNAWLKVSTCEANGLAICCETNIGFQKTINVYNGFTWLQNILPEFLLIPLGSIIKFSDPKEIKRIKVLLTKRSLNN